MTTGAVTRAKLQSNRQPAANQQPTFYRPDALPVAQPTASKHWSKILAAKRKNKTSGVGSLKLTSAIPRLSGAGDRNRSVVHVSNLLTSIIQLQTTWHANTPTSRLHSKVNVSDPMRQCNCPPSAQCDINTLPIVGIVPHNLCFLFFRCFFHMYLAAFHTDLILPNCLHLNDIWLQEKIRIRRCIDDEHKFKTAKR